VFTARQSLVPNCGRRGALANIVTEGHSNQKSL
jgi:hypothetical protein